MAATLCYPEIQVNEALSIGRGVANWEGMAQRMTFDRSMEIKMALTYYSKNMPYLALGFARMTRKRDANL